MVFALATTFLPAAVLLAVELVVGLADRGAGLLTHAAFVGGLVALFAIQAFERLGVDGTVTLIAAAVVAGAAAALAAWRARPFRAFLTLLTPAPAIFLALFLFASPVADLVFPGDVDAVAGDVRSETPVVLLVLDELPVTSLMDAEGRIDAVRFPSFARLAEDSTWFRTTTTPSASTTVAVPALLTGTEPDEDKLPVVQSYPENLFTLLAPRYRLNVTESQTRLCPAELCERDEGGAGERLSSLWSDARVVYLHLVAPPALEERLPAIDEGWGDFGGERAGGYAETTLADERLPHAGRERDFERFVEEVGRGGEEPVLHALHVLFPHGPWVRFPGGRRSAVETATAPGRSGDRWTTEALAVQAHQRHLLQLGYTDRLLGRLLAALERTGVYERALVVVTADHGVSFRGGDNRREPTPTNVADLAFVPLFVKRPGAAGGGVVDRHVRTVDVLPTIADVLGFTPPGDVDGRSAFAGGSGSEEIRVGPVAAPLDRALAARRASLARQVDLFGSGAWDVFAVGPYARLVGRRVGTGVARADADALVDHVGSRLLRSLPEDAPAVPSPLAGRLAGVDPGTPLAVALNGRIEAVTEAFDAAGDARFSALLPESAFRRGRNEVRIFVVDGPPSGAVLREVRTTLAS